MNTSKKSFFTGATLTVQAGTTVLYDCTGQLFICKESDDAFKMSFNEGEFFPMEVGLGFRLSGTDEFTRLSFYNDTASDITIQFYVGVGEIRDARLNTIVSRITVVGLKDISDFTKGAGSLGNYQTAPSGWSASYPGTVSGKQRKQITFQNVDATAYLWVGDANNLVLAILSPGQAWTMQSSGTFKVSGNGTTCSYLVCQTFYNS